ncbi:MAG: sulfotransferase [Planctomycetes bacterium]|nr:sulfotransferase [Planctomycetota bacterium]
MIRESSTHGTCCIHVGLPKTATTMLQDHLFARHSGVEYLGTYHVKAKRKYNKCRDKAVQEIIDQLIHRGRSCPDLARCRHLFAQSVVPAMEAGRVPLWSWESLGLSRFNVRQARAENLRAVFEECKVVIALRNPLRLVESVYFQNLRATNVGGKYRYGRGPRYLTIDRWLEQSWTATGKAPLSHLDYAATVDLFARTFGKESVGVFLFEELVEDNAAFIESLCRFIGIDPQEGIDLAAERRGADRWTVEQIERLKRAQGSLFRSTAFRFVSRRRRREMMGFLPDGTAPGGERARAPISERWQERIVERTREGNQRLVEQWGLPMEKFGYPL